MVVERVAELLCAGGSPVSCASGLVERRGRLYVVSDDDLCLAVFDDAAGEGRRLALSDEVLPEAHHARKAAKPDLEALAIVGDALLVVGSGSTPRRERGWLWRFEGDELREEPEELDLGPLYADLRRDLADLNIEGAAMSGGALWLAQRGNGTHGVNALVELDPERFPRPDALRAIVPFDLGEVHGVRLSFSDLAPLGDGRLAFSCIAEAGESTYHDGDCVAAGVGVLDPVARVVERIDLLEEPHKIEGITPRGERELLLVSDPDDASVPSPLLAGVLTEP